MKITNYAAAIAIGLTCFAGQASAMNGAFAQVTSTQGSVAVDQNGKIAPASSSTTLSAGDRVVSMAGSSAQIKFSDGCVIDVRANAMATVGSTSPCAGSGLVGKSAPMELGGLNGFWGAAAVFGLGAILIAAYASSKSNDHDPVSP